MFDSFWEFVWLRLVGVSKAFSHAVLDHSVVLSMHSDHVFDYWHLLDCNCSIAKRLWWMALCAAILNFHAFPLSGWAISSFLAWNRIQRFCLLGSFPQKSFFLSMDRPNRYVCTPLPTSTLRFLVSDRRYRSILPTTHFTALLPTLFFSSRGVFAANIVCTVRMSKTIALTSKSILVTWAPRWAPKRFSTCVLLPNEFSEYFRFVSFCEVTNK